MTTMTSRTDYSTQTPMMSTLFSGQYLRNHWTLDIGVLGYIGIVWPKEHSPKVRSFPPGTLCIYIYIYTYIYTHTHMCVCVYKLRCKYDQQTQKCIRIKINCITLSIRAKNETLRQIYFTLTFAYMIYGNLSERSVYCTVTRLLYISYLCDGVWVELITGFGIFLWPLSLCITSKRLILGNQAYKRNIKKYSVSCSDQQIFMMNYLWLLPCL